nr:arginine N-succinyltransferase [Pseudomonadota bacterium]
VPGCGHSEHAPFWRGIGRHFYPRPFPDLSGDARLEWESQLASLLPRQPLVVSLLDAETQRAIGAQAQDATMLRDAASRCGFRQSRQVRICDGGPVFEAPTSLFRFAPGTSIKTTDRLNHGHRCIIRAEDRGDAWIVDAERVAGGIEVASASHSIADSLRDRAWAYAFF